MWSLIPRLGSTSALYFTDHNHELVGPDGLTYTPVGGFDVSAAQIAAGLKEQNVDIAGVINSDRITHEDLRGGRWRAATVVEQLVDWYVPWVGAYRTRHYTLGRIRFTGETWTGELSSFTNKLHNRSGSTFSRPCQVDLASTKCGVDLSTITDGIFNSVAVEASSQNADEPRRIFDATTGTLTSTEDDWFNYGKLTWTTGNNASVGHVSVVKDYADADRRFTLYENCPFDIADGDLFTIETGCDKLRNTCRDKFSNILNHRGDPFMPSSDRALRTPST